MAGHECFHCKQWVEAGKPHDCWTTTEAALLRDVSEDLRDAYDRLRETAHGFGDQRIHASHHSIMFSRRACYFFVRPKRTRVVASSRIKRAHVVHIVHRDQVEAPLTNWLAEAYRLEDRVTTPRAKGKGR